MFSLTPYRFRLRFYAAFSGEDSNSAVEYAQGAFNFNREVNVPRGIDDVDAVVFPMGCRSSRRDRNAAFLFLSHPVHGSSAVMNFTDFMNSAGIEQNTFGCRGFTSIDVSHDANISRFFQRKFSWHGFFHSSKIINIVNYQR